MEKSKRRTRISRKQKFEIVLKVLRGESMEELSRTHRTSLQEITQWRALFLEGAESSFKPKPNQRGRESELERIIGRQQMEIELLKKKMKPYGTAPANS